MRNAFQTRILAVALAVATLGVCVLAGFNFSDELNSQFPTDGVVWMETQGGLQADRVPAESAGGRAGIHVGDVLEAIAPTQRLADQTPTQRLAQQEQAIDRIGSWNSATYTIARPMPGSSAVTSQPFPVQVVLEEADHSIAQGRRLIALVYLLIGLYVLFRRWTAPKSLHFFIFCLFSFVAYAFREVGDPGLFDRVIHWGNLIATTLQPALFLHFAFSFSDAAVEDDAAARLQLQLRRKVGVALLYVPAVFLIGLQAWANWRWSATALLNHRLDQLGVGHMALYYVVAAVVFYSRYAHARTPLERQQLKWLTRGTLLAVGPYTVYAVLYLSEVAVPGWLAKLVLLALVVLPLSFSWAIVRYRLMDVDLIFKRGVTYTLATAALAGLYFAVVAGASEAIHARYSGLGAWGPIIAIIVIGLSFDPLKRMIQARVDRIFDRKSFDYRETLIDFGRSLNSQTDLRALLDAIVERLPQTLLVTRVAVFLKDDSAPNGFELAASHGLGNLQVQDLRALDLGFLRFDSEDSYDHLFFENPQLVMRLDGPQRRTVRSLDLNY
jgi:two-component system, NtrC family, sensor kinase